MIYLFGSTGMLGNYVKVLLSKTSNVICITRSDFDILKDTWTKLEVILKDLKKNDVIINCAGVIPQNSQCNEYKKYIKINTLFPHKLQNIVEKKNAKLVHITTDCVFNGKKDSSYNENDKHTETNIYGVSKSLGEPENATVIRTSIIGEELKNKKSLLEWVKSNKDKTINGYVNHLWNGVTCLQLAQIIQKIINNSLFWKGIKHVYSPNIVSKYKMCQIISEVFNLNINILEHSDNISIDKSLISLDSNILFSIPSISTQIKELQEFSIKN